MIFGMSSWMLVATRERHYISRMNTRGKHETTQVTAGRAVHGPQR